MSFPRGPSNGYTNGYRAQEQGDRYDDENHDSGPVGPGGRRARRAGGYGGFSYGDVPEQPEAEQDGQPTNAGSPDPYNPPTVPAWRRAQADDPGSQDRTRLIPGTNRQYGDGPGGRQIEGKALVPSWKVLFSFLVMGKYCMVGVLTLQLLF